jgi:hypothetical protein
LNYFRLIRTHSDSARLLQSPLSLDSHRLIETFLDFPGLSREALLSSPEGFLRIVGAAPYIQNAISIFRNPILGTHYQSYLAEDRFTTA